MNEALAVHGIEELLARVDSASSKFTIMDGPQLDVRHFRITESLNEPFEIVLDLASRDPDLDLEALVCEPCCFETASAPDPELLRRTGRFWQGIVREIELVHAEPHGSSHYRAVVVPAMWLMSERRNHRIFQRMSEAQIADKLLGEWGIERTWLLDPSDQPARDYRVQYAESDLAFVDRMLEDAGVTYFFDSDDGTTRLVLTDAPHRAELTAPLPHTEEAARNARPHVTKLSVVRRVQPGRYTMRDADFRLPPTHPLVSSASSGKAVERRLERFHYVPGAFAFGTSPGGSSPAADDKMAVRTSEQGASSLARRRMEARRTEARSYSFETTAFDLKPGACVAILCHVRHELGEGHPLLVTRVTFEGDAVASWKMTCTAKGVGAPHRPSLVTPKPRVSGVETAVVVGARATRSTPMSSAAFASTSTGIARATWTTTARAGFP